MLSIKFSCNAKLVQQLREQIKCAILVPETTNAIRAMKRAGTDSYVIRQFIYNVMGYPKYATIKENFISQFYIDNWQNFVQYWNEEYIPSCVNNWDLREILTDNEKIMKEWFEENYTSDFKKQLTGYIKNTVDSIIEEVF